MNGDWYLVIGGGEGKRVRRFFTALGGFPECVFL